jgi:hypothetical protein
MLGDNSVLFKCSPLVAVYVSLYKNSDDDASDDTNDHHYKIIFLFYCVHNVYLFTGIHC